MSLMAIGWGVTLLQEATHILLTKSLHLQSSLGHQVLLMLPSLTCPSATSWRKLCFERVHVARLGPLFLISNLNHICIWYSIIMGVVFCHIYGFYLHSQWRDYTRPRVTGVILRILPTIDRVMGETAHLSNLGEVGCVQCNGLKHLKHGYWLVSERSQDSRGVKTGDSSRTFAAVCLWWQRQHKERGSGREMCHEGKAVESYLLH